MNPQSSPALGGIAVVALGFLFAAQDREAGPVPSVPPGSPPSPDAPDVENGKALFDKPFRLIEGLGAPELNADSCRGCHQDPVMGGAGPLEVNVTRHGFDNGGIGPFVDPPNGQGLSKLFPPTIPGREEYDSATTDVFEQRQTPSILGDGLIDGIPAWAILANEDPTDLDGDGIFGVARRIDVNGVEEIGRFGWKAQVPRLRDFVNDAAFGELGLTAPDDGRGFNVPTDGDATADPELTPADVDDLDAFLHSLPAPQRKGSSDPLVAVGEGIFAQIGCATCHVPSLTGGDGNPVPLYSNLLLHDVMPDDFRGMAEEGADVGMYRTPPLWGISDTPPYMHDGRAEDLTGAILAHDSEAAQVRTAFQALSPSEQGALISFLEDL